MIKCEVCDKRATSHVTEIVEGDLRECHFCEEHAPRDLSDKLIGGVWRSFERTEEQLEMWRAEALRMWKRFRPALNDPAGASCLVRVLIEFSEHPDPGSRCYGAALLGQFCAEAKDPQSPLSRPAWLADMGSAVEDAFARLRALLEDPNELVRLAAKRALETIE